MTSQWYPEGLKTICVDFNGVLDTYSGYIPGYMYPPRKGAEQFLAELAKEHDVVVLTAANALDVWEWLKKYGMEKYVKQVTNRKVPAIAYIDDRAICFNGNFDTTLNTLTTFRAYWETEGCRETPLKR